MVCSNEVMMMRNNQGIKNAILSVSSLMKVLIAKVANIVVGAVVGTLLRR